MTRIDIFDGIVTLRNVPIFDACPDPDDRIFVQKCLRDHGHAWIGGGAAPRFYVTKHQVAG
jgi:hypothetical protein